MEQLKAPSGFEAAGADRCIKLRWNAVQGAEKYRVFLRAADSPDRVIRTRSTAACRLTLKGLANGREYLLTVRALHTVNGRETAGAESERVRAVPVSEGLRAQETLCLEVGQSAQLKWECRGKKPEARFSTDAPSVVSVSADGVVKALSRGRAGVVITSKEDSQTFRTAVEVGRREVSCGAHAALLFTGGITAGAALQRRVRSRDFHGEFSAVKGLLAGADLAVGALEACCCDGAPYAAESPLLERGGENANAPSTLLNALSAAGFGAVVTAACHSCDAGFRGIQDTAAGIRGRGMRNIGTLGDDPVVISVKGMNVAFIAVAMTAVPKDDIAAANACAVYSREFFVELVNMAHGLGAEYIIALPHWGSAASPLVTKKQAEEARFMAQAGADLIIGAHPQAVQRVSLIETPDGRKVPCAYSLGRLITSPEAPAEYRGSALLRAELYRTQTGVSARLTYTPCICLPAEDGVRAYPCRKPFSEESRACAALTARRLGKGISCENRRPRVLLSGSPILGDIFSAGNAFRVDKTAMRLSQVSLGSGGGGFSPDEGCSERLRLDIAKDLPDYIKRTAPDIIAVDFCTAAASACYMINGSEPPCCFTARRVLRRSAFFAQHKEQLTRVAPPFGEEFWKPALRRYAEILAASGARIILFRTEYGAHTAKGAELRAASPKTRANRLMREMEDFFIDIARPAVVELSRFYFPLAEDAEGRFEPHYSLDAYRAALALSSDAGVTCISAPSEEIWFSRVVKYYASMTARSFQSWLLNMDCAADRIIASTSAEFAAKHAEQLIRLKRAGGAQLTCVGEFFAGEPEARELVHTAQMIQALLDGDLSRGYDFYESAFKGKYVILRTMMRLLAKETGAAVNDRSVELMYLLRGKPQQKRYIQSQGLKTLDIWGSCVSRESANMSDAFIGRYIFKQPALLAFEPPVNAQLPEGTEAFSGNAWRRRTLENALSRSGIRDIESSGARWILLDFFDLISKMAEYSGGLFEIDDTVMRMDFYKDIKSACRLSYLFERRGMKYCFDAMTRFAGVISERYGGNIILIKAEPKSEYITLDNRLAPLEDDGMAELKKKFISLCEERFAAVTGCYVIDISKHFYSSDSFVFGGAHIVHYEEEFYRTAGRYISEIIAGTDRQVFSAVDENYLLLRSLRLSRS